VADASCGSHPCWYQSRKGGFAAGHQHGCGAPHRTELYNKAGAEFLQQALWGGHRAQRCLLHLKQEEELLEAAKQRALKGELLAAKQLCCRVEEQTAGTVCDDYRWDLLHRHGWSKKAPRPQHPKAEEKVKEQREAFKKKHPHSFAQEPKRQSP
jgi:transposase